MVAGVARARHLRQDLSRARRCRKSLGAAVEPPVGRFNRHEQKMAIDRDVALPAGADHGGDQLDLRRVGDVIEINAAVVPDEEGAAMEGQVGVGAAIVGARTTLRPTRRRCTGRRGRRSRSSIEGGNRGKVRSEAGRLWQGDQQLHTKRHFTGVVQAGLQSHTRIIRPRTRIGVDRWIILSRAESGKRYG